ncbi:MAG: hypothetical protein WCD04_06030 [Terriglobia bacterium]|jgi:hypothetical protein
MANFVAWREEEQILLPQGGIRMTCPAAAGAERSVAKNLLLVAAKVRVVLLGFFFWLLTSGF